MVRNIEKSFNLNYQDFKESGFFHYFTIFLPSMCLRIWICSGLLMPFSIFLMTVLYNQVSKCYYKSGRQFLALKSLYYSWNILLSGHSRRLVFEAPAHFLYKGIKSWRNSEKNGRYVRNDLEGRPHESVDTCQNFA